MIATHHPLSSKIGMGKPVLLVREYLDHVVLYPRILLQAFPQQGGIGGSRPGQSIVPGEDGHDGHAPIPSGRERPEPLVLPPEQPPRVVPGGIPRHGRHGIHVRRGRSSVVFRRTEHGVVVILLGSPGVPPRRHLEGPSPSVARSPDRHGGYAVPFPEDGGRGADVEFHPPIGMARSPLLVRLPLLVPLFRSVVILAGGGGSVRVTRVRLLRPRTTPKHVRRQHHHRLALERDLVRQRARVLREGTVHVRQQQHALHLGRRQLRPRGGVHAPVAVVALDRVVALGAGIGGVVGALDLVGS
mmetsp:Transcript_2756/g.5030  ORF Transcript_2756/g.5030 Transcript_2756/m.5030 type:complete len:300 (+) Transcript_2756:575-1474(+)